MPVHRDWSTNVPDPEARARIDIDRLLEEAGWRVQDRNRINIPGVGGADSPLVAGEHAQSLGQSILQQAFSGRLI